MTTKSQRATQSKSNAAKLIQFLDDDLGTGHSIVDPFVRGGDPVTPQNVADHIYAALDNHASERDQRGRATVRALNAARYRKMWDRDVNMGFRGLAIARLTQNILSCIHNQSA